MLGCVIGVSDAAARETEALGSGVDIRIRFLVWQKLWGRKDSKLVPLFFFADLNLQTDAKSGSVLFSSSILSYWFHSVRSGSL